MTKRVEGMKKTKDEITKHLLMTLLIAGISATAQAEQWLCKGERAVNINVDLQSPSVNPVSFVLSIDRAKQLVEAKGDIRYGVMEGNGYWPEHAVTFDDDYIVQAGSFTQSIRLYEDGDIVLTKLDASIVEVVFAKCDKL